VANVVVIIQSGKIYDGLIDIKSGSIMKLELMEGVQPIVSVSPYQSSFIRPFH
jgi:primary-amine oxidase